MYLSPPFRGEGDEQALALISEVVLGELVTFDGGRIIATPLPFLFEGGRGERGALVGHLARANDQWRSFDPAVEALVVFRGPSAYVSPAWYATKAETGAVVPTWDYATVHVRGRLEVRDDEAFKRAAVTSLSDHLERRRSSPWSVTDAPEGFIAAKLRAIVGIEIAITSIEAKWKMSQNQPARDRAGVVAGLLAEGGEPGRAVAALVAALGPPDGAGAKG